MLKSELIDLSDVNLCSISVLKFDDGESYFKIDRDGCKDQHHVILSKKDTDEIRKVLNKKNKPIKKKNK